MDLVDVLPAAAEGRLHDAGQPDELRVVLEVRRPHVAQALRGDVVHVLAVGEDDGLRLRDTQLLRRAVAEELVVRRAPERVVDAVGALQGRHLQVHRVVRHLVAHAVEDQAVGHGLVELGPPELDELGLHPFAHRVDLGHEGLAATQDADSHGAPRWWRAGTLGEARILSNGRRRDHPAATSAMVGCRPAALPARVYADRFRTTCGGGSTRSPSPSPGNARPRRWCRRGAAATRGRRR